MGLLRYSEKIERPLYPFTVSSNPSWPLYYIFEIYLLLHTFTISISHWAFVVIFAYVHTRNTKPSKYCDTSIYEIKCVSICWCHCGFVSKPLLKIENIVNVDCEAYACFCIFFLLGNLDFSKITTQLTRRFHNNMKDWTKKSIRIQTHTLYLLIGDYNSYMKLKWHGRIFIVMRI